MFDVRSIQLLCFVLFTSETENIYVYLKHIFKLGDYVECKK